MWKIIGIEVNILSIVGYLIFIITLFSPTLYLFYFSLLLIRPPANDTQALRIRAKKQRAAKKPNLADFTTGGSVIENIAQTRRLAETTLDNSSKSGSRIMPDDAPTNTASGSNEDEDENAASPDVDDCHVIVNDKSTEFMLATVVEETGK